MFTLPHDAIDFFLTRMCKEIQNPYKQTEKKANITMNMLMPMLYCEYFVHYHCTM